MEDQVRFIIEFNKVEKGVSKNEVRVVAEVEVSKSDIEDLNNCEKTIMRIGYEAMRKAVGAKMTDVSKKKGRNSLEQETKL